MPEDFSGFVAELLAAGDKPRQQAKLIYMALLPVESNYSYEIENAINLIEVIPIPSLTAAGCFALLISLASVQDRVPYAEVLAEVITNLASKGIQIRDTGFL